MEKIVFLGDSIIANFKKLSNHENIINMGIGGDKTVEIIGRFRFVFQEKPDKLFFLIGINDYLVNQNLWPHGFTIPFYKTYDVILDMLKTNLKETQIFLISILPINSGPIIKEDCLDNFSKGIKVYNDYIKTKALEYDMEYLVIGKHLQDENGFLNSDLTIDGVHLNEQGYDIYYREIKKFFEEK